MSAQPIARDKLDTYGIDQMCEDIGRKKSLTAIARSLEVSPGTLIGWIEADPERSARAREARAAMARVWDEEAARVIRQAPDEFSLKKAKELAHHYRWRASKIAPKEYGDRTTLAGDSTAPLVGLSDEQVKIKLAELLAKQ